MGGCLGSCVSSSSSKESPSSSPSSVASSSASSSASSAASSLTAAASCLWRRSRANRSSAQQVDEQDTELISNARERCRQSQSGLIYRILKFKRKQRRPQFIDKYQWDHQQPPSYAKLHSDSSCTTDIQLQNLDVYKLLNVHNKERETDIQSYARIASSRASSSLDLEWEHEYSQLRQHHQQQQHQHHHHHHQHHEERQQQHHHHHQLNEQPQQQDPSMIRTQLRYASMDQLTNTAASVTSGRGQGLRQHQHQQQRLAGQRHGSFTRTSCCSSTQNSWSHISTPESLEWDIDAEHEQQQQLRVEDDNLDDETLKLLHQIEQLKNHVLQETGDGLSNIARSREDDLTEGLQFRATHFGATELGAHIS